MTLKVGEVYRGMFAYDPHWLRIAKIEIREEGRGFIHYHALETRIMARWLWWMGTPNKETVCEFVKRLDEAKKFRSVSEVEVKYR